MGAAPAHPRLVRNMSMPALHHGGGAAGAGVGFTRVSSFSRMPSPALLAGYHPVPDHQAARVNDRDDAADVAVVPQLESDLPCSSPPPAPRLAARRQSHSRRGSPSASGRPLAHHSRPLRPGAPAAERRADSTLYQRSSASATSPAGSQLASSRPATDVDEYDVVEEVFDENLYQAQRNERDPYGDVVNDADRGIDGDDDPARLLTASKLAEYSTLWTPTATRPRPWALTLVRVLTFLCVPRTAMRPSERSAYLLIAALAYMAAPPALGVASAVASLSRPDVESGAATGGSLLLPALTLLLVPTVARATRSIPTAVALFVAAVLLVVVSAADLFASPVVMVWTSIVPLAAFSALPTRGVLLASVAAASAVFAADVRGTIGLGTEATLGLHDVSASLAMPYFASPSIVIASWVVFLGLFGVVQRQIHAIVAMNDKAQGAFGPGGPMPRRPELEHREGLSREDDNTSETLLDGIVPVVEVTSWEMSGRLPSDSDSYAESDGDE